MICPICYKELKTINYKHLKNHNLSPKEFKNAFPNIVCMSDKEIIAKQNTASINNEIRWSSHRLDYKKNPKKCLNCKKEMPFSKKRQSFCNLSCSTSFNNKEVWKRIDKTHPWRNRRPVWRSNGEKQLFDYMQKTYPDYNFKHSKKFYINSRELSVDMYSEEKKTIIEYDGRIHFVPYYGQKRLNEVIERDNILKAYCIENNIKLIRINEKTFKKYDWKEKMQDSLVSKDILHFLYFVIEN